MTPPAPDSPVDRPRCPIGFHQSAANHSVVLVVALLIIVLPLLLISGCGFGPRSIHTGRLRYNEAVKATSEQQLLLNIVRLRYTDAPSSLALSSIADQRELVGNLGLTPFFTSAGAGNDGTYRGTVIPGMQFTGATRPTLSYTPMDDQDFTRRLFTPITLDGTAYLSKTTWPISSVFRLYLENLNWVSNAETGSGPTPCNAPEYAEFLAGIQALQRLQDRKLIAIFHETSEEIIAKGKSQSDLNASTAIDAVKEGQTIKWADDGSWTIVHEVKQPVLRIGNVPPADDDFLSFCQAFHLNANLRSFELTTDQVDPFYANAPPDGLDKLDLETRSLLQVLFFISHGVDVPATHIAQGLAPSTMQILNPQDSPASTSTTPFDWSQVMQGLIKIHHFKGRRPPACALVAVQYQDYWFYIDQRDRDSKSTFMLLLEVSRLELNAPKDNSPILSLPLGG